MRRILFLLAATLVLVLLLLPAAAALASTTRTANIATDATPTLRNIVWPAQQFSSTVRHTALEAGVLQHDGRDPDLVLTLYDNTPGHQGPYLVPFWKEYVGIHSDIYVGWNDLASGPDSVQQDQTITGPQITYVGQQFDQRIWESDVFHFGNYLPRSPRPDIDGTRAAILVHNIRDEAYWGPFRFYTAGYFTSGLNNTLQINAIFIDSFNWASRLGVNTTTPSLSYLYEGVVAHEFQHLIHQDIDPNEADFINEGMAEIAMQFIYGTSTTAGEVGEYLTYHRDSLTDWKGELFDYGDAALWQDYLWERMGGGDIDAPLAGRVTRTYAKKMFVDSAAKFTDPGDRFIWNLIHDQASGMAGVADGVGGPARVEQLHRDWTLANLLDGKVSEPQWNYRNLALGGADSDGYSIDDGIGYYDSNVNGNLPPTRKNVRRLTVTEPWGAYYRTYGGQEPGLTMTFSGNASDGVAAHSVPTQWYSGLGNMLERSLVRRIDAVPSGATLSFWTWYDIEPDWDYGYVEASTNGTTWTKLAQTSALPAGTLDLNGSTAWDGPGGLTGVSGGWQQASYSMGAFNGSVYLRFRYATDEAANGVGWYVDDINVGAFSDPVAAVNGWTPNGWLFTSGLQNNDWTADVYVPYAKGSARAYAVQTLVGTASVGTAGSTWVDSQHQKSFRLYGIVSNRPDGVFSSTGRLTIAKRK